VTDYVVDTSVFLRWWVDQIGWEHARRVRDAFLAGDSRLVAPSFTRVELGNVLRKVGLLHGVLDTAEYLAAARSLDDLGVELVETDADGIERACALAARQMMSVYDALGAALALDRGIALITADRRSARSLAGVVDVEVLEGVEP